MNGAESLALVAPPDAPLVGVAPVGPPGFARPFGRGGRQDKYVLRCVGRACDGAMFDIVTSRNDPILLLVTGTRPGLPPAAAGLAAARGPNARPQYAPDTTIVLGRAMIGGRSRESEPDR
jgi:hypothetical protein